MAKASERDSGEPAEGPAPTTCLWTLAHAGGGPSRAFRHTPCALSCSPCEAPVTVASRRGRRDAVQRGHRWPGAALGSARLQLHSQRSVSGRNPGVLAGDGGCKRSPAVPEWPLSVAAVQSQWGRSAADGGGPAETGPALCHLLSLLTWAACSRLSSWSLYKTICPPPPLPEGRRRGDWLPVCTWTQQAPTPWRRPFYQRSQCHARLAEPDTRPRPP